MIKQYLYKEYGKKAKNSGARKYIEDSHCKALIEWIARVGVLEFPELALLYKIQNESALGPRHGARMKAIGVKAGILDYCLPVARQGYNALYVEMKGPDGVLSSSQKIMIPLLCSQNNKVVVCHSAIEAEQELINYLRNTHGITERQNRRVTEELGVCVA